MLRRLTYLGLHIIDAAGQTFAMVGALPCATSMANTKTTLGYRVVGCNNLTIKGLKFHYSALDNLGLTPAPARITSDKGAPVPA